MSFFELGGIAGSLVTGFVSDRVLSRSMHTTGGLGRIPVVAALSLVLLVLLVLTRTQVVHGGVFKSSSCVEK
jgi:sugar phosphate permease